MKVELKGSECMNLQIEEHELKLQSDWKDFSLALEPFAEEMDKTGEFSSGLLEKLQACNFLVPFLPKHLGGDELGLFHLALGLEEISKVIPVVGILIAQQVIMGIRCLSKHSAGKKDEIIKELASFRKIISLAATEFTSGSDLDSVVTTISQDDPASFSVTGGKAYVNWAKRAGLLLLFTRNKNEDNPGKTLVCLELPNDGAKVGVTHETMGLRGIEAAPVDVDVTGLAPTDILGVFNYGQDVFDSMMNEMRTAMSAIGVGLAQGAFTAAATHAKARKQSGKPIGSFQSLQWRFADAATKIEAARLHSWRSAEVSESGNLSAKQAAIAKIFSTEAAFWVADFAVQVLGSKGFVRGSSVERFFRDSRFLKIGHGSSEVLRNLVAAQM